jgi:hypothetical protein
MAVLARAEAECCSERRPPIEAAEAVNLRVRLAEAMRGLEAYAAGDRHTGDCVRDMLVRLEQLRPMLAPNASESDMRQSTEDTAEQIAAQAVVIRMQRERIAELQAELDARMAHLDHRPVPLHSRPRTLPTAKTPLVERRRPPRRGRRHGADVEPMPPHRAVLAQAALVALTGCAIIGGFALVMEWL